MTDQPTDNNDTKTNSVNDIKLPPSNIDEADSPTSEPKNIADEPPSSTTKSPESKSAPEPPRWRFVNEAKKSLGYSSLHAGSYIKGQSNNELGAKYTAPDVSLYKPAKEEMEVGKVNSQLPANTPFTKDEAEVGKLGVNAPPQNAFANNNNQVGKLNIREPKQDEIQSPSGSFGGLPKNRSATSDHRAPFKEWDVNIELGPKTERDHVWYDSEIRDSYKIPGDEVSRERVGSVGKIGFHGSGASEDAFVGEVPKARRGQGRDTVERDEFEDDYGEPREGALFTHRNETGSDNGKNRNNNGSNTTLAESSNDVNEKKKRRCIYLLLLVLLILVVILGVLFGQEEEERATVAVAAATTAGVLIPPIIILNETSVPSEMPTMNQSTLPSTRPSEAPSKKSTSSPSLPPNPPQPTKQPTNRPTPQPTCSIEQDFNLCVAVDMSGSVCNDGIGYECLDCRAEFLPMFFDSPCRDSFVSEDTCCNNFDRVKEFSSSMVNLLGDFPADKTFSVVQFATTAQLVSGLNSAGQTTSVMNGLDYTGGLTNHAAAIQLCQQSLSSLDSRKNFIMLVTDGVSSEPGLDPEGAAEEAATSAKLDGTFIMPIFISPNNDLSALAFMSRLSSDGTVFDVTDFDSLNILQDRLVDQVSCS